VLIAAGEFRDSREMSGIDNVTGLKFSRLFF